MGGNIVDICRNICIYYIMHSLSNVLWMLNIRVHVQLKKIFKRKKCLCHTPFCYWTV